jgi:hypothetical protein
VVSPDVLRDYRQALRQYHLHPEAKFLCGRQMDRGPTRRRHVFAEMVLAIGKEANEIEEDETFGVDEDSTVSYGLTEEQRKKMIAVIAAAPKRKLARAAGVSDHTIDKVKKGESSDDLLTTLYGLSVALLLSV